MSLPLDRTAELLQSSAEHLVLVAVTMAIAASVGIPLGVWLHRHPRVGRWILGLTGVTQTIPSLALFGFLIPLHLAIGGVVLVGGIGPRTAIAVLVLYALLPVVRNTVTGLQSVDPRVREAGLAMGLTPSQLFWKVELPLAWKIILAGLRVATIATVGSATVAAAIDAGGLGKFIFRGLRMNDHGLILMGALPSAAIALLLDSLFGGLERLRIPTGSRLARPVRPAMRAAVPVLAALACFLGWRVGGFPGSPRQPVRVVVGAKDFTEQLLLGEWVAQTLEREPGLEVVRRFDLGGNLAHDALIAASPNGGAMGQILLFVSLLEALVGVPAVVYMLGGGDREPGDFNFDPFGLAGPSAAEVELTNARLAMLSFGAIATQAALGHPSFPYAW